LAAVFGAYLYLDLGTHSNLCTTIIPDSATSSFFANSTISGVNVTYSDGSSSFYLSGVCPQPVHQNLYNAVSIVSQDPRFVREENGSQFTIDPTNSILTPTSLGNGSSVEALLFNDLNQSDPIFPCNLDFTYSNPIARILVILPVVDNGTQIDYSNESIAVVPSSIPPFNCPQETGVATVANSQLTNELQVGGFDFELISNSSSFVGANGTSYPGYDYAFNVTYVGSPPQNVTQQVVFTWPSEGTLADGQRPTPFIATPFNAYVVMRWFTNSTGLYLTVTTLA
jgi:hypothetical protein